MRSLLHPSRVVWLVGILLLIGTVAGAGWMMKSAGDETASSSSNKITVPFRGNGIVAFGYVDVEPGVTPLYPEQLGRVTWVAEEGAFVEEGEVILKIDDEQARIELKEAEIGKRISKKKLEAAEEQYRKLQDKQKLEIEAQQKAIDGYKFEKKAAQEKLAKAQDLYDKKVGGSKFDLDAAQAMVDKLDAVIAAEKKKLEMLKKLSPSDSQVKLAKLALEHSELLVKKAQDAVEGHKIVAPVDGDVLRVLTSVGAVLGPNPRSPAVEFCPKLPRIIRTEVLQEWADRLKVGQEVIIEDDTTSSYHWKGKVARVSDWFTKRRSIIQEPFQFNDVRTLECIVVVEEEPGQKKLRIGQRMRVMIKQGGP